MATILNEPQHSRRTLGTKLWQDPTPESVLALYLVEPKAQRLLHGVATMYNIPAALLLDKIRGQGIDEARQVSMALLADVGYCQADISRFLGRDHSTIVHGVTRARRMYQEEIDRARIRLQGYMEDVPIPPEHAAAAAEEWLGRVVHERLRPAIRAYVVGGLIEGRMRPGALPASGLLALAQNAALQESLVTLLIRCGLPRLVVRLHAHLKDSSWKARS